MKELSLWLGSTSTRTRSSKKRRTHPENKLRMMPTRNSHFSILFKMPPKVRKFLSTNYRINLVPILTILRGTWEPVTRNSKAAVKGSSSSIKASHLSISSSQPRPRGRGTKHQMWWPLTCQRALMSKDEEMMTCGDVCVDY